MPVNRRASPPARKPERRRRRARKHTPVPFEPVGDVERVLALDSSSRACGWAVFDNGELVEYGHYRQQGEGHGERLTNYASWLAQMFQDWQPTRVIYEAPYQGRMRNTYGILSRYVGVIEAVHFAWSGREFEKEEAVPAHLVKKAIGAQKGKDHEQNKKIVLLLVNKRFGLNLRFKGNDISKKVTQDDDADAIALNWAWHRLYRSGDAIDDGDLEASA